MKFSEIKNTIKIGDATLVIFSLALCLCWFLWGTGEKDNLTVTVYSDGNEIYCKKLSTVLTEEKVVIDGCEIIITNEGAYFSDATCPDKLCIKHGTLKNEGDVMACVPSKVTVRISSDKSRIDGVSY